MNMALKQPTPAVYHVYRQDAPIYLGKLRNGDDDYAANLIHVGEIRAWPEDAMAAARKVTGVRFPVLEMVQ